MDRFAPLAEGPGLVEEARVSRLRPMLRRFWPDLRPFRWGFVLLLVLSVAMPGVEAFEIWLFQRVVDHVLLPKDISAMYSIALLYVGLSLLGGVISWVDSYLAAWIGEQLQLNIRARMLARLQSVSTTTLDKLRAGDVLTRLTSDVAAVEGLTIGVGITLVGSIAKLGFFGFALFRLDWRLALLSLTVVPAFWVIGQRFARRLKAVSRERRRRAGGLTSVAEESLAVTSLVQIHGREAEEAARFDREARAVLANELGAARLSATFPLIVDFMELLGVLAVMAGGTWAMRNDRLTLGGLLVFLTYLSQMYKPVRSLGDLGNNIVMAMAGVERVEEVLDLRPGVLECPGPIVLNPAKVRGEVEVVDVKFTYPGALVPALRGISCRFRPGRLSVLNGPSGSGKSTMIRMLARLDDPDEGTVRLDGTDLQELQIRTLRDTVTVLLQEAPVLDATVRENITFAKPDADDEAVWAALRAAGVDDVVAALPEGLDARLQQRGRSLSGGQRQRIALARALVTGAKVLILDEPTTGLDRAAADRFLATLRELVPTRTIIIATHDTEVLAAADDVITLRNELRPTGDPERLQLLPVQDLLPLDEPVPPARIEI
ncbi:MAG TPA: ABC transporter ATP-binding protein [Sporichthyaceae bacterium]|nr:ABC transporter ATP-binding protein [Sporichthyaceae bacterium]